MGSNSNYYDSSVRIVAVERNNNNNRPPHTRTSEGSEYTVVVA